MDLRVLDTMSLKIASKYHNSGQNENDIKNSSSDLVQVEDRVVQIWATFEIIRRHSCLR